MTYEGTVQGGIVVLEPGVQLTDGTRVRVEPISLEGLTKDVQKGDIFRMGELAVDTGIPDLATNADHYLYGHPKVSDAR
jgi:hypothetical protein